MLKPWQNKKDQTFFLDADKTVYCIAAFHAMLQYKKEFSMLTFKNKLADDMRCSKAEI